MKKIGKLKNYVLATVTLVLCFAIAITCMSFVRPQRVFAAGSEGAAASPTTVFENVTVPEKCDYGDTFKISSIDGVTVTVTAPNGSEVDLGTATDGKYTVTALQTGIYTVKYAKDKAEYTFNVYVSLDEEYILKVDNNGADIPTYIQKGGKFTLPQAKIAYYDENNILQTVSSDGVNIKVSTDHEKTYKPGEEVTASDNGKMYVYYSATVNADGKKYLSQTYTVNVQSTFTDTSAPKITVAGITKDISVNRVVTLPKATATDNYDENIKVEIKVNDPHGNPVRITDIDRYGYAYQDKAKLDADADKDEKDKAYKTVEFDNDKTMSFYPVEEGQYTVSYVATDDSGNKSSESRYTLNASDLAAPVFKKMDKSAVPENWGVNVFNSDADDKAPIDKSGKITLPMPTLVDNKDHMYAESDDDTDLITLYVSITDSDNSKTIVEFKNILAADVDGKPAEGATFEGKDDVYGKTGESYYFNKDNAFEFDFGKYHRKDSKGEPETDLAGKYTIRYRAEDKSGNRQSETFTVNLTTDYTDTAAPSAAEVTVPDYVSATDDGMTIPSPVVADKADSNLNVVYRVYSNNGLAAEEGKGYITVEGGEDAKFVTTDDGLYLVIDKDKEDRYGNYEKKLKLGDSNAQDITMYFYVAATDAVGNTLRNTEGNVEDYTKSKATVKIIGAAGENDGKFTGEVTLPSGTVHTDDKINVGGFKIETSTDLRKYTGFEVVVKDGNGDVSNVTLETFTAVDETSKKATIYVKNITFLAGAAGDNTLTVRVFDVNGRNSVYSYAFTLEKSTQGGGTASATTVIGTTGSINVKYKLHNETMENVGEANKTYYVVRKISGGAFSLMGIEFTAKTQGSYSFTDGYIDSAAVSDYKGFKDKSNASGNVELYGSNYTIDVSDTAKPVIELQGVMPTYAAIDEVVEIPSIVAYSENGLAEVKVTVKDGDSREVLKPNFTYDEEKKVYSFKGTKDGVYTVTITATRAGAEQASSTYSVNIGDVIGPEFTVSGGTTGRLKQGDVFTFGTMNLAEGESKTGVTITKKLLDPSREEVSGATVNGSYNSYYDATNNNSEIKLDKSGTYEVVYTATDSVGNTTTQRVSITVAASGSSTPTTFTTLSIVLIVVAVVLLAGVIIYVVRFRKVKK